ncbi:MAG: hypothetical protein ACYDA9_07450 [Terriglobia bacterium]
MATQVQSFVDASSPSLAFHLATLLIAAGAAIVIFLIYLLVFVPIRIYSMQREIRSQGEQIEAMKSEIRISNRLMLEARAKYEPQSGMDVEKHELAAKSRLHQSMRGKEQDELAAKSRLHQSMRGNEQDELAAKSRLHQFIFSDRSEQQTKVDGPQT